MNTNQIYLDGCTVSHIKFLDTWIDVYYHFYPEEPTIYRTQNGDGHPGNPKFVEIQAVYIGEEDITDLTEIHHRDIEAEVLKEYD